VSKRKKSNRGIPADANELADTIHLVTLLAAPNLLARVREGIEAEVFQKAAVECVTGLVRIAASAPEDVEAPVDMRRVQTLAAELERELRGWTGPNAPSEAVLRLAREVLVSLAILTPAGGWDAFELPGAPA
jgi:hypothetical protein